MRIKTYILAFVFMLLGAGDSFGEAIRHIDIPPEGGAYAIYVHPDVQITLRFPNDVEDAVSGQAAKIAMKRHRQLLSLRPRADFRGAQCIVVTKGAFVNLFLRVAERPEDVARIVEFRDREAEEAFQERVEREVKHRMGAFEAIQADREAQRRARAQEGAERLLAGRLLGTTRLLVNLSSLEPFERYGSVQGQTSQDSAGVVITEIISETDGEREIRHARFRVTSYSDEALQLTDLRFRSSNAEMVPAEMVLFQGRGAEQVGLPFTLRPRQEVTGIARIPDDRDIPSQGLTVAIDGPTLLSSLVARAHSLAAVDTFEEEYQQLLREQREREARAARGTQTILSAVARGGAHFVAAGVADETGNVPLDAVSTWAVGGRVTKGLAEPLAFEAEIVGGRTGSGRFDDAEWDGMVGDIERSASFGRIGVGIVLRLGDVTIPYAHAGAGVQLASYTSTFTNDGTSTEGPGDGFELAGFVAVGGGIDYRIGRGNLVIGVRATYMSIQGGERLIDASVQLGAGL